MTVKGVAGILSRLQVHVLVVPQAAHPRLSRLVVIEFLQFFVEGILNQQAAALVVWAHAHRHLRRLVEAAETVAAGGHILVLLVHQAHTGVLVRTTVEDFVHALPAFLVNVQLVHGLRLALVQVWHAALGYGIFILD